MMGIFESIFGKVLEGVYGLFKEKKKWVITTPKGEEIEVDEETVITCANHIAYFKGNTFFVQYIDLRELFGKGRKVFKVFKFRVEEISPYATEGEFLDKKVFSDPFFIDTFDFIIRVLPTSVTIFDSTEFLLRKFSEVFDDVKEEEVTIEKYNLKDKSIVFKLAKMPLFSEEMSLSEIKELSLRNLKKDTEIEVYEHEWKGSFIENALKFLEKEKEETFSFIKKHGGLSPATREGFEWGIVKDLAERVEAKEYRSFYLKVGEEAKNL